MKSDNGSSSNDQHLNPPTNPLVSVIILNYNGKDVLEPCLASVFSSSYSPFEVIVVDNCSRDGSAEAARKRYNFRLIKRKNNSGYSAGNNAGIRASHGKFLVLLNNDVIVDPDWLDEFVQEAIRSKADFCQPKIIIQGRLRTINSAGNVIHIAGFGLMRGSGELDTGQYDDEEETYGLHGACIFASRKAIEKVGLLDASFFAFNEDTDWAWRALLKKLKLTYVPRAVIYHVHGKTWGLKTTKKLYYAERNRLMMLLTNYSHRSLTLLLPLFAVTEVATFMYCLLDGSSSAKILGYADLLRMRKYIDERRRWIQAGRLRSDREIIKKFTLKFKHPFLARYASPLNWSYTLLYRLVAPFL